MTQTDDVRVEFDAATVPVPPQLADADIEAAVRVLRSGRLTGANHPEVVAFEEELASWSGAGHSVAVNSGTAALHCVLLAMGIGPGDEVIVPAHTFIASATPVLMAGATPVIVDVDAETYCIDPDAAAAAVGPRTKAVIAVHINGHPAPMDLLPKDIPVISDACQAHGATLDGKPVGTLGVAAALSFFEGKLLTAAGEGGAVLTGNEEMADRIKLLREHGLQRIGDGPDSHHVILGYNYRLTGVQAAVARSQLGRLDSLIANRRARAEQLTTLLADLPGIAVPTVKAGAEHVYWRYVMRITNDLERADVLKALAAEGVGAAPRYPIPLTIQPALIGAARMCPCPVTDMVSSRLIMLTPPASAAAVEDLAAAIHRAVRALSA
jgi:perosamine synthetase